MHKFLVYDLFLSNTYIQKIQDGKYVENAPVNRVNITKTTKLLSLCVLFCCLYTRQARGIYIF